MALFRSVSRLSNLAKVSQYVDKLADLGKKNLLFRVNIKHLYSIWQLCKSHEEYQLGLIAVNHFYNFGRQLSPEGVNKLFAFSMRCGELEESIKLLEGTRDWLRKPPDIELIYLLMSTLISQREYAKVKRAFKAVRSHWQLKMTDTVYKLCIESMLCLQNHPLEEALMVYCDSAIMGTALPNEVHCLVLDAVKRKSSEEPGNEKFYSTVVSTINRRLLYECGRCSLARG